MAKIKPKHPNKRKSRSPLGLIDSIIRSLQNGNAPMALGFALELRSRHKRSKDLVRDGIATRDNKIANLEANLRRFLNGGR